MYGLYMYAHLNFIHSQCSGWLQQSRQWRQQQQHSLVRDACGACVCWCGTGCGYSVCLCLQAAARPAEAAARWLWNANDTPAWWSKRPYSKQRHAYGCRLKTKNIPSSTCAVLLMDDKCARHVICFYLPVYITAVTITELHTISRSLSICTKSLCIMCIYVRKVLIFWSRGHNFWHQLTPFLDFLHGDVLWAAHQQGTENSCTCIFRANSRTRFWWA